MSICQGVLGRGSATRTPLRSSPAFSGTASARRPSVSAEPLAADAQAGGRARSAVILVGMLHVDCCAAGHPLAMQSLRWATADVDSAFPLQGIHWGHLRQNMVPLREVVACCDGEQGEPAQMLGQRMERHSFITEDTSHACCARREACTRP